MQDLLFVLGRTQELSYLELSTLFPGVSRLSPSIARVPEEAFGGLPLDELMALVGGTAKIARYLGTIPDVRVTSLLPFIDLIGTQVVFGVSPYDCTLPDDLLQSMKSHLRENGISSRYIEAQNTPILSSVVFAKEHLQELVISKTEKGYVVGKVLVVQPFEMWNARDYGRPYADPKLGMLPLKVARMAINCSLGREAKGKVLLDPFCGMGTVLTEALVRGASVIGSDLSQEVLWKAEKNIEWLAKTDPSVSSLATQLFTAEATHISDYVPAHSIDAIVTEPFMGDTRIGLTQQNAQFTREKIKNTIKGLEKLYIGCLKDWSDVLKPNGKIFMAFPKYIVQGRSYFVKKVIDTCENFGYTKQAGPIEYSRPQATVRREFYLLTRAV